MREKYIDERYPGWLTFGLAQVTSSRDDWAVKTPDAESAQLLVDQHRIVHDALTRCAMAFAAADTEAFTRFWYGAELTRGQAP